MIVQVKNSSGGWTLIDTERKHIRGNQKKKYKNVMVIHEEKGLQ